MRAATARSSRFACVVSAFAVLAPAGPVLLYAPEAGAQNVNWVGARNGQIPRGAVVGGSEGGTTLYVCRTRYRNGTYLGKLFAGKCNIGEGGREIALNQYEVMTVPDPRQVGWATVPLGRLPDGAVVAGTLGGGPVYTCRMRYGRGVHPGRLDTGKCTIGWGGREVSSPQFEMLYVRRTVAAQPRPAPPPSYNPPPRPSPPPAYNPKPRPSGGIGWAAARNGQVPRGAVAGGDERGRTLYICRASYQGGVHPGKLVGRNCNIGWGGREVTVGSYEVMVGSGTAGIGWAAGRNGSVPRDALAGGSERGRTLYVCRARYQGGVHPGKLVGRNCNIGWGGREVTIGSYEVMTLDGQVAARPTRTSRPTPSNPPPAYNPPPRRPGPPTASAADPYDWVAVRNGRVPRNAVSGGSVGGPLFHICRASYRGGVHPGKLHKGTCYIGWGGKEIPFRDYEAMTHRSGLHHRWVGARNGAVPQGAVAGGDQGGTPLYVCRAKYGNHMHPGKLHGRNCNIGLGGRELTYPNYQVMVGAVAVDTPPPVARGGTPRPPPGRPTAQSPPGRPTVASAPPPTAGPYRPGPPPGTPPPQAAATRSFALANRTLRNVELYRGGHDSSRHYVGTVPSGRVYSSESRVGEMFYFSQDNRWVGAYRIDARARRQLIELPTLQVYEVD